MVQFSVETLEIFVLDCFSFGHDVSDFVGLGHCFLCLQGDCEEVYVDEPAQERDGFAQAFLC